MAAFLREGLVLEMERRDAGTFEGARRALGRERIAVAGIGIGDHRHRDRLDDFGEPRDDLVRRHQPHVGHAGRARDGAAARIDGRKARLLDEARRQSVERAGGDDDFSPAHHGPKCRRGAQTSPPRPRRAGIEHGRAALSTRSAVVCCSY